MLKELDFSGWEPNPSWCVPSAISMITGIPVAFMHMRAAFLQSKRLKDVKGLLPSEAVLLLSEQGWKTIPIDLFERYGSEGTTVGNFLKNRTPYEFCMPILFMNTDHCMCAHYEYAGDNHTKKPIRIKDFHYLKTKITNAWIVYKN